MPHRQRKKKNWFLELVDEFVEALFEMFHD